MAGAPRRQGVAAAVLALSLGTGMTGCGSGDGAQADLLLPTVADIDAAIEAVEGDTGERLQYFEISAHLTGVTLIAAVDDGDDDPVTNEAVSYSYVNGVLGEPTVLGRGEGATFTADRVEVQPGSIFDGVEAEIDDPIVTDFAITGGPEGEPIYDCTLRSANGGQLRARLGPDGSVLEVMAE